MSWTFRTSNENGGGGAATTVAVTVTGMAAHDVIVVGVGTGDAIDVSSVDDTGSAYTARALNTAQTNTRCKFFYKLDNDKAGSVTYTATYASAATAREIHVWAFTPVGTPSFDVDRTDAGSGAGAGTAIDTGAITTTAADEVVVTFCYHSVGTTLSSQQINGVAADGTLDPGGNATSFYRIVSGTFTGNGTGTAGVSVSHVESIISFKIAGGGETITVDKWFAPTQTPMRRKPTIASSGVIGIKS